MPTYLWVCGKCVIHRETVTTIHDRNTPQTCDRCGAQMEREITAPLSIPDIEPYIAVAGDKAGQVIGSRRAHKEFLKRNRLVEVGNEPIRSTKEFRKTVTRREIRDELRRVVPEVLKRNR